MNKEMDWAKARRKSIVYPLGLKPGENILSIPSIRQLKQTAIEVGLKPAMQEIENGKLKMENAQEESLHRTGLQPNIQLPSALADGQEDGQEILQGFSPKRQTLYSNGFNQTRKQEIITLII
ncbi:hypothetical protein LJC05_00760 [Bacteroides sp. OttesenSCG-928-J23]|nr:hypothetical protein [Bacteroides sp. OttesenSCG-928-J23]MDL2299972.1 hypothetical protein [Bacteroides sp. OttesenSCG-928-E20]